MFTCIPVSIFTTLVAYTFINTQTSLRSEMVNNGSPSAEICVPADMDLAVTIPDVGDLI
jgi:hypothetical protein